MLYVKRVDVPGSEGAMISRRLSVRAAWCGTIVLAGLLAPVPTDLGSPRTEVTALPPIEDSAARSVAAAPESVNSTQVGKSDDNVAIADAAIADSSPILEPTLSLPSPTVEAPTIQFASLSPPDPVPGPAREALGPAKPADPCPGAEMSCVDRYLWSMYERAPKLDTVKVSSTVKVTVTKKGKTRTVSKTVTKLVDEDFGWKDPKAAQKAGMSMMDYVIGGMDPSFRVKLYHALRAMDDAGLEPGITSAFRDDYRQGIASGKKAARDSSYHGGSRRGGYGHGMAADLVSVKGETRAQRWVSSEALWKWIDAHEHELAVARPYLDRDQPHVGPIDGKEYADKRGRAKTKQARAEPNRPHGPAAGGTHGKTKSAKTAPPKAKSS